MKFDNSKIPEGRENRLMNTLLWTSCIYVYVVLEERVHHLIGNRNAALQCLKVRWFIWLTAPGMNWTGGLDPGDWRSFWWLEAATPLFDDQTLPPAPRRLYMGPKKDTVHCLFSVSYSFSFFLPSPSLPREIRLVRLSIEQVIKKTHTKTRRSHLQTERKMQLMLKWTEGFNVFFFLSVHPWKKCLWSWMKTYAPNTICPLSKSK